MRTLKYIGVFFAGSALGFVLGYLLMFSPFYGEGHKDGSEEGRNEVVGAIKKEFGDCDPKQGSYFYNTRFEVLSAIETNGVKTIRVVK